MGNKHRSFTRAYKLAVISEVESGKQEVEVAREHGLHPNIICRWKREFKRNPETSFSGKGKVYKDEARIAKLERIVGQLYAENEFLKKTLELLGKRVQEEKKKTESGRDTD